MSQTIVAKRYSNALLQLANNNEEIKSFQSSLEEVSELILGNEELSDILANPRVYKDKKLAIVNQVVEKSQCEKHVGNLIKLLVKKNRAQILKEVTDSFRAKASEKLGIANATIVSYKELDEQMKKSLLEILEQKTQKKLIITYKVDESILGGVVFRLGYLEIDASIQNYFQQIKKNIL